MFLIDTDIASEMRKVRAGKADRRVTAWFAMQSLSSLFLSTITTMEIQVGVLRHERKDPAQAALYRAWLRQLIDVDFDSRVLSVNLAVALRCAELQVPDPRPFRDSLIAATALVHGLTVVTRNVRDFAPMGVTIVNPWD